MLISPASDTKFLSITAREPNSTLAGLKLELEIQSLRQRANALTYLLSKVCTGNAIAAEIELKEVHDRLEACCREQNIGAPASDMD